MATTAITRVRAIDSDGDWTFGQSKNNYLSGNNAIAQNINTRLNSVLGNCFFDVAAGIDWFNLLSKKDQTSLNLAIASTILNTDLVTGIKQLFISLNTARQFSVSYVVKTVYSTSSSTFVFDNSVGG